MAVDRKSLSVGLTVLTLAAVVGVTGIAWLRGESPLEPIGLAGWIEVPSPQGVQPLDADAAFAKRPHLSGREEAWHVEGVERLPRSGDRRYAYALYLYGEGRIDATSEQLSELFKFNNSHQEAGRLHTHINELQAMSDPSEREAKRAQFLMEATGTIGTIDSGAGDSGAGELNDPMQEFQVAGAFVEPVETNEGQRPGAKVAESPLDALDARYGISAYSWAWEPSPEEAQRASYIDQLEMRGKFDEAHAMHREQLRAYPDSPAVIRAYAVFLLDRGHTQRARQYLADALDRFPAYPELMIARDGLAEITALRDPTEQSAARKRLAARLSDAAVIRMNVGREDVATN